MVGMVAGRKKRARVERGNEKMTRMCLEVRGGIVRVLGLMTKWGCFEIFKSQGSKLQLNCSTSRIGIYEKKPEIV